MLVMAAAVSAQVNVLTANYNNQRTNSNPKETILTLHNVNTQSFGKLGYFPVDGEIYAQPLYVSGVTITGHGTRNVVYIATMHNSVYAIDAAAPQSTVPLWQVNLGPSVPSSVLNFTDILPEVGILSTPVIDLTAQAMYLVSDTLEGGTPVLSLHALSLADGHEMLNGPVVITATVAGNGAGSTSDGKLSFDPSIHLQRPGLALANGLLYLAFGSRGDLDNWHGWLMSYRASNLQQVSVTCTSPNSYGASIWQSGRAPAIGDDGNIYVVTGNGEADGTVDFSESVLKVSGADLSLIDWYTSDSYLEWNINDTDLGSSGAILLSNPNQVVTIGKSGDLFLVNRDAMGHLGPKNSTNVQSIQANQNGSWNTAVWNSPSGPVVFIQEQSNVLSAYQIVSGVLHGGVLSQSVREAPTVFAGLAISSNNNAPGSTIVWQTTADYGRNQYPGTLHALDASDLSHELWNSDMVPNDVLGRYAKFVAPTVANGRVYVPTFSNELVIYGLLSAGLTPIETAPPQITSVTNGASFLGGALSPGELVAIFGANLGPQQLAGLQVDGTGRLTSTISNTQVFFDGVAAPLLYASANQVGAMVPFGITAATTQLQVQYNGQRSAPLTIPVVAATPALFSRDGTGGQLGAILDQDGKSNQFNTPAARGSIIMMYATGLGQTNPAGKDGKIVTTTPYPAPILPVTVLIDNQPAEVLYAGAAPEMVQGVFQVNARVPASASVGEVHVVLNAGKYSSPNTATVVVQ